jgi:hypothetical protein
MTSSTWLRHARPTADGLLVPGHPRGRACDLLLTPAAALVGSRGPIVDLPYEDCTGAESSRQVSDGWRIVSRTALPAAVSGTGLYAERLDGLHDRRRGIAGMMDRLDEVAGTALLYRSSWNLHPRLDRDCAAIAALCEAFAIRIDWRRRLLVPGPVRQLLDDLAAHPLRAAPVRSGLRSATIETLLALKRLGYLHRFEGRPLPDEAQPDPDEVIGKVVAEVAANPYGSRPDEASVSALVHRHYLDVTPWPFHALLEKPRS